MRSSRPTSACEENLSIKCVPTSHATETQARALGLTVVDFAMVDSIDYLFDGADEVDPDLRMIKGRGGAAVVRARRGARREAPRLHRGRGQARPAPGRAIDAAGGDPLLRAREHPQAAHQHGLQRRGATDAQRRPLPHRPGKPGDRRDVPDQYLPEDAAEMLDSVPGSSTTGCSSARPTRCSSRPRKGRSSGCCAPRARQ